MNVTILQFQIVIIECPRFRTCPMRTPLDDLADHLRQEMRFGRDADRKPADAHRTFNDLMSASRASL